MLLANRRDGLGLVPPAGDAWPVREVVFYLRVGKKLIGQLRLDAKSRLELGACSSDMEVLISSGAARIAVMTTDESVTLAAQESLASNFHITLLDAAEGLLAVQNERKQ
jgi:hypothetical protein